MKELPPNMHITNGKGSRSFVEVNSYGKRGFEEIPVGMVYSDRSDVHPIIRIWAFMKAILFAKEHPDKKVQFVDYRKE